MREGIHKHREQREQAKKLAKKDMVKFMKNIIKREERLIDLAKKDLQMFEKKGLSGGDFAFHREYGKCLILNIEFTKMERAVFDGIEATISSIQGEQRASYQDLIKPGPGLEVLFEESKAEW